MIATTRSTGLIVASYAGQTFRITKGAQATRVSIEARLTYAFARASKCIGWGWRAGSAVSKLGI